MLEDQERAEASDKQDDLTSKVNMKTKKKDEPKWTTRKMLLGWRRDHGLKERYIDISNEDLCMKIKQEAYVTGDDGELKCLGHDKCSDEMVELMVRCFGGLHHNIKELSDAGELPLSRDELFDAGIFGIINNAVPKFDPSRGSKFITYAKAWIEKWMRLEIDRQRRETTGIDQDDIETGDAQGEIIGGAVPHFSDINSGESYIEHLMILHEKQLRVKNAMESIPIRSSTYLAIRFGFDELDRERTIAETAYYFYISEGRARKTEKKAVRQFGKSWNNEEIL